MEIIYITLGMISGALITILTYETNSWGKWEVVDSGKSMTETSYHQLSGEVSSKRSVEVDVMRRVHKRTGEVEYKNITRY